MEEDTIQTELSPDPFDENRAEMNDQLEADLRITITELFAENDGGMQEPVAATSVKYHSSI